MSDNTAQFIDPSQLRIGMYVYLDVGWMDHPFPVNNFEISSVEQISKIQSLGLEQVRYLVHNSQPDTTVSVDLATEVKASEESPKEKAARQRRNMLADQNASLLHCEKQFQQATQAFKYISEQVHAQPLLAKDHAQQVVQGLLKGILSEEETSIRLLSENAGEKTSLHSVNVTILCLLLGKALKLSKPDMQELGIGSLLHDLGKMELPDRLRYQDDQLSNPEQTIYQSHVAHGVNHARKMQLSDSATLLIAQHHEYINGSGYPSRVLGNRMTQLSQIISLVNRYDNLCNPSNFALAITPHEALAQLFTKNKAQFDGPTLTAFIKMMGIYPPGSVVQLTNDRYALVTSVNSVRPIKPKVLIHDPSVPVDDALIFDLDKDNQLGIRRSLKPMQLPKATYDYLSPRKRLCYFFERGAPATETRE
jgi:putative nucleotidyltransferase with HDIG domain